LCFQSDHLRVFGKDLFELIQEYFELKLIKSEDLFEKEIARKYKKKLQENMDLTTGGLFSFVKRFEKIRMQNTEKIVLFVHMYLTLKKHNLVGRYGNISDYKEIEKNSKKYNNIQ